MVRHYFARHAHTQVVPSRRANLWNLSPEGQEGARRLAEAVRDKQIDHVITSGEPKTIQTGECVASSLDIPLTRDPDLGEQRRGNSAFIDDPAHFRQTIRQLFERPNEVVYGTESANQALSRFGTAAAGHMSDTSTLIVTHGTVLSLYIASVTGQSGYEIWSKIGMPCLITLSGTPAKVVEIIDQI